MAIRVLLTDGELTNALAAVRCLGKHKNIEVYVTSQSKDCLSSSSKYCKGAFTTPNPLNEENYISHLIKLLKSKKFDALLPIGYFSERAIIKNKSRLKKFTSIPTVEFKTFEIASRKDKTVDFAKNLGVPVPITHKIRNISDLKMWNTFPVVIKATEAWGSVKYAKDANEMIKKFNQIHASTGNSQVIVQEHIPGINGYGFYAVYDHGKMLTYYIHERLHMYPRSGGAATLARTYYNKEIFVLGKKILDALKWHGVVMVEFKKSEKDGKFYLMEINPKYWGSLDLGITAGSEIPYYHLMLALKQNVAMKIYKKNVMFRWPTRDFLYAISGANKLVEILKWFALFFSPQVKDNIWLTDFGPTLFQIQDGFKRLKSRLEESKN